MDKIFKALADKNRRKILTILKEKELSVNEILKSLDITQATLSNHLSILRKAGLVNFRINGKLRIYRINSEVLFSFIETVNKFVNGAKNPLLNEIGVRDRK